jgi:hypothetical protein
VSDEMRDALEEVLQARRNGWQPADVGDLLTFQLERADRLRDAGWDPTKIPWEQHGQALSGAITPPASARLALAVPADEPAVRWLERVSDLLAEPDPGPTPFLVEDLVVEQAIAAVVGPYKASKTYVLLELAIAIATGGDALGTFSVPQSGPVVLVVEESGRTALHRRLARLQRGYALEPDDLSGIHFAANQRVRLNEEGWRERLIAAGRDLRPRAFLLDPLVRLKGATVDENIQREIGPVLDFLRDLREETGATVLYSHHTGHQGSHQRGSSDLEGYWESRLEISKNDDGTRSLRADHREAESGFEVRYRLAFDEPTQSLRLNIVTSELERLIEAYLRENPTASKNEVNENVDGRRTDVLRLYDVVKDRLTTPRLESS